MALYWTVMDVKKDSPYSIMHRHTQVHRKSFRCNGTPEMDQNKILFWNWIRHFWWNGTHNKNGGRKSILYLIVLALQLIFSLFYSIKRRKHRFDTNYIFSGRPTKLHLTALMNSKKKLSLSVRSKHAHICYINYNLHCSLERMTTFNASWRI